MVFVIQCDPEVPPGLVAVELQEMHADWKLVRLDEGDQLPGIQSGDLVIVLGGRMSANDDQEFSFLPELKIWIKEAAVKNIPYLGICLGAQLLAAALGSKVIGNRWGERGNGKVQLTEDGINDLMFKGLPQQLPAFQWHDDSFDLPDGATLLASSAVCPHQAFRLGNAWGLQFHPEITPEIISGWAITESSDEEAHLVFEWLGKEKKYGKTVHLMMKNFLALS